MYLFGLVLLLLYSLKKFTDHFVKLLQYFLTTIGIYWRIQDDVQSMPKPVFLFKNLFILILSLPSRFSKLSMNDSLRKLSEMLNLMKHKPSILIKYIKFSPQYAYRLSPFNFPNIYFHVRRIFSSDLTTLFYVFYPSLTNIL